MKASNELIFALRRTAARVIDQRGDYSWMVQTRCNCGILVRELCGYSEKELQKELTETFMNGSWNRVGRKCRLTGIPVSFIFKTLCSVGFEIEDFAFIEHAGQSTDTPDDEARWQDPQYVHDFFLKLADDLEMQLTGKIQSRYDHHQQP